MLQNRVGGRTFSAPQGRQILAAAPPGLLRKLGHCSEPRNCPQQAVRGMINSFYVIKMVI
jgi:hypothetical protein